MPKTIVVIGGAASGPVAAARARGFDEEARIILLEKNPHISWVHADLRYHLEDRVIDLGAMDAERATFFEKRHRIEVRTGTEAVAIDVDARRVVVKDGDGTSESSQSSSSSNKLRGSSLTEDGAAALHNANKPIVELRKNGSPYTPMSRRTCRKRTGRLRSS